MRLREPTTNMSAVSPLSHVQDRPRSASESDLALGLDPMLAQQRLRVDELLLMELRRVSRLDRTDPVPRPVTAPAQR